MNEFIPKEDLKKIYDSFQAHHFFNGTTILITGACGFLGKALIAYFQYYNSKISSGSQDMVRIIAMDNFVINSSVSEFFENDRYITVINHDITQSLDHALRHVNKINYIFNCAGIASPSVYKRYPLETMEVSYTGTKNILELALKHEARVLNFSSSEVYATPPDELIPTPESYIGNCPTMDTRSCYDIGKMCLETLTYIYSTKYLASCVVVRPFNMYSYVDKHDTRVLPNFIKAALENKPLKVYGKDNNTRTFCFVTDGIEGFLRAITFGKNGHVYNIGNPSPEITIKDLAKLVKKIAPESKSEIIEVEYPEHYPSTEPHRRCPDLTKSRNELGYNPTVSLEEGVSKFYKWAKIKYRE